MQAAYLKLKSEQGFRITEHNVDADSATPRACVTFSESLVKTVDYTPFVTLNGQAPKALEAKDKQICVEGLVHGETYKIAFRTGLPSSVDEVLEAPVSLDVYVKDRSRMVRFTGDSFVLPSTARRGIPLVSVNLDAADLKLYRIGDRGIAPLLTNSQFLTQLDGYSAQNIEDQSGELVWQGSIEIANDLNKDVVTSFPVDEALPERKPGVYVLIASPANAPRQRMGFARRRNGSSFPISASPPMPARTGSTSSRARLPPPSRSPASSCSCLPRTTKCSAPRRRTRTAAPPSLPD